MIKIVKIISGEELIAEVEEKNGSFILKKPCLIQLIPSKSNPEQPMMGMFPYASYAEDHTIEIHYDSVVWVSKPVKELYNQYNSVFGSGIQLAGL